MLCENLENVISKEVFGVLILVLMEDALRVVLMVLTCDEYVSLNPCSNGRCSASSTSDLLLETVNYVLILVLMEDALREDVKRPFFTWRVVLILVLMEDALRVRSFS